MKTYRVTYTNWKKMPSEIVRADDYYIEDGVLFFTRDIEYPVFGLPLDMDDPRPVKRIPEKYYTLAPGVWGTVLDVTEE